MKTGRYVSFGTQITMKFDQNSVELRKSGYVHDGLNADEQQRKVFDGLIPHTGSNVRGSFNHRFAQPSRAVDASYFYPGDQFLFGYPTCSCRNSLESNRRSADRESQ